ncbi:Tubulin/FtsZ 2-layer sandwich domain [Trinorchestia longiramus]|nr:Tubulin/FtsZ 2-layer sandwich domain [Trinorchestia longiramus]
MDSKLRSYEPVKCSGVGATSAMRRQPPLLEYDEDDMNFLSFFEEGSQNRYRPRAVFVDTDPSTIGALSNSPYARLYSTEQLVRGTEDAANNFARGYYTEGRRLLQQTLQQLRLQAEACDSLQGFMLYHSYGGGTGSGLTALLADYLSIEYPKKIDVRFAVMPSTKVSSAVVEPYNAILSGHNSLQHCSAAFAADNSFMYDLAYNCLAVARPSFHHINAIFSQTVSSVTGSLRFDGALSMGLSEICTNLVPFPRLHFIYTHYAPLVPQQHVPFSRFSTMDITRMAFQSPDPKTNFSSKNILDTPSSGTSSLHLPSSAPRSFFPPLPPIRSSSFSAPSTAHSTSSSVSSTSSLWSSDISPGVHMACCLMYRGQVKPTDITAAIKKVLQKRAVKFVNWTPTGFKVGVNYQPVTTLPGLNLTNVPRSVCVLSNTTTVRQHWDALAANFDKLFSKKAFCFWYLNEGMTEEDLVEAREDIAVLQADYKDVEEMAMLDTRRSRTQEETRVNEEGEDIREPRRKKRSSNRKRQRKYSLP